MNCCSICGDVSEQDEYFVSACDCEIITHKKCLDKWRINHINKDLFWICNDCNSPYSIPPPKIPLYIQIIHYLNIYCQYKFVIPLYIICLILTIIIQIIMKWSSWKLNINIIEFSLLTICITLFEVILWLFFSKYWCTLKYIKEFGTKKIFGFILGSTILISLSTIMLNFNIIYSIFLYFCLFYTQTIIMLYSVKILNFRIAKYPNIYMGNDIQMI